MKLVFDIVKNGKNIPSKRNFHFEENGGTIGRNEDNDWVLNDPNSYISGTHVQILCKHGTFFIKDESTNGTFLKNPYKKLPKGHPVKINASDVFIIGDHEIQARFSNNDYNQGDIINTSSSAMNIDSIIPNDDFIFDSKSSGFASMDSQEPNEMDVMDILGSAPSAPASNWEGTPDFMDVKIEERVEDKHDISLDSFFSSPSDEPIIEVASEIKEEVFEEHIEIPSYTQDTTIFAQCTTPPVTPTAPVVPVVPVQAGDGLASSVAILEQRLGLNINGLAQADRDILMADLADIITITLESLKNSLAIKDKTIQDLQLSSAHQNSQDIIQ